MAELKDVKYSDWQLSLAAQGEIVQGVDDINQCVLIICTTQKGSDPLRPEFGIDIYSYIDKPINLVLVNLTKEIIDQLRAWEPRCIFKRIVPDFSGSVSGKISFSVEWELNSSTQVTKIIYG